MNHDRTQLTDDRVYIKVLNTAAPVSDAKRRGREEEEGDLLDDNWRIEVGKVDEDLLTLLRPLVLRS
jgi:hypothetical protein